MKKMTAAEIVAAIMSGQTLYFVDHPDVLKMMPNAQEDGRPDDRIRLGFIWSDGQNEDLGCVNYVNGAEQLLANYKRLLNKESTFTAYEELKYARAELELKRQQYERQQKQEEKEDTFQQKLAKKYGVLGHAKEQKLWDLILARFYYFSDAEIDKRYGEFAELLK